jgi:hypothetical protein
MQWPLKLTNSCKLGRDYGQLGSLGNNVWQKTSPKSPAKV